MDSAVAALIGAAIGGSTTLVVAWLGPRAMSRATARAQRRDEIREEIAQTIGAMLRFLNARRAGDPGAADLHVGMVIAATRLQILLGRGDHDIDRAIVFNQGDRE